MVKERKRGPEIPIYKEFAASMAEHAYLTLSPTIQMGVIPSEQLQVWREALSGGVQSPLRMLHLASLDIETVVAVSRENNILGKRTIRKDIAPFLISADKTLQEIPKFHGASKQLQMQAELSRSSLEVFAEFLTPTDGKSLLETNNKVLLKQGDMIVQVLTEPKKYNESFIQSLTALTLLAERFLVMPAPTRFWSTEVDPDRQAQLYVINMLNGYSSVVRVAPEAPEDVVHISYSDLKQDGYKVFKQPYGTLAALGDLHNEILTRYRLRQQALKGPKRALAKFETISPNKEARDAHLSFLRDYFKGYINAQITKKFEERFLAQQFTTFETAFSWYQTSTPFHNFELQQSELQKAIKLIDTAHGAKELDFGQIYVLSSMHTEAGMVNAKSNPSRARAHFRKAEDLLNEFSNLVKKKPEIEFRLAYHQGQIDKAALSIYQAVALQEQPMDEVIQKYNRQLLQISYEVFNEQNNMQDRQDDYAQLEELQASLTALLLLSTDEKYPTHLPVASTFRQAKPGGWAITTWFLTAEGYQPHYFGRLDVESEDSNVLYTLSKEYLSREVLLDLLLTLSGDPQDSKVTAAQERVEKARKEVKAVADKFED